MQINFETILSTGIRLDKWLPFKTFQIKTFQSLLEMNQKKECQFLSPVHLQLRFRWVSDYVEAAGTLETAVRLACSRCLSDYDHALSTAFFAIYHRASDEPVKAFTDEGGEVSEDETDVYSFKGDVIDFTEAIQEQLVMSLPIKPLCQESCKGLCNGCGADLNQSACQCQGKNVDPRLAILKI